MVGADALFREKPSGWLTALLSVRGSGREGGTPRGRLLPHEPWLRPACLQTEVLCCDGLRLGNKGICEEDSRDMTRRFKDHPDALGRRLTVLPPRRTRHEGELSTDRVRCLPLTVWAPQWEPRGRPQKCRTSGPRPESEPPSIFTCVPAGNGAASPPRCQRCRPVSAGGQWGEGRGGFLHVFLLQGDLKIPLKDIEWLIR